MAKGKLLAEGTNQFFSRGANNGHEQWQISQLGHGGILLTSRAAFTAPHLVAPQAQGWSLTFEVDRAWSPVSLSIRLEQDGQVTTTTQRVEGKNWVAQIERGGEVRNYELPFTNQHEVDFGSTLFNTVTLLRARLPVGSARDLDVIFVEPASLVPTANRQRYECLVEDKVQVPAGNFPGLQYRMTYPGEEGAGVYDFWADHSGIILMYQSQSDEIKLERYRRNERR